jgi:hypothetical protein
MEQLTFTEQELTDLIDFYNFIVNKAELKFTVQEAVKFARLTVLFKQHMDKVNSHIMELKRIVPAQKKEGKK